MSSQLIPAACISPNPDIAGIGVRSSIYVQSFLTTIMFFIFGMDNKITPKENRALHAVTISILMTACSLLVSSFIQAATAGISAYHTQIVLNLSWINSTSLLHASISDMQMEDYVQKVANELKKRSSRSSRSSHSSGSWWKAFFLSSLHFSAMSALGLWLWIKAGKFGSHPDCNNYTIHVLFGHNIPFTNKGLKIFSLIIYGFASIPVFNGAFFLIIMFFTTVLLGGIIIAMTGFFDLCFGSKISDAVELRDTSLITVSSTIVAVFLNLVFIIDNELMIRRSAALVQAGDSEWTFGQTLALVLLALPAVEIYKAFRVSTREKDVDIAEEPVEIQEGPSKEIKPAVENV